MRDRTRLSLLACALVACVHPRTDAECSGRVASLDGTLPRRLHVRVLLTREAGVERHELVVRTAPGRIEAIGLTPMGTQAYRVTHDRKGVEVENRIGAHLGLSPRLAYDAVARAYLDPSRALPPETVDNPRCGYRARLVLVEDVPLGPAPGAPPPP